MKTETEIQNQKIQNLGLMIENTIKNIDSELMDKSTAIRFNPEFWKEKTTIAKKKFPELNKFLDSDVKNALVEIVKDFVVTNIETIFQ
jgi:hypothetical protein